MSLFSKEMLAYYIRCLVNFGVCSPPWPSMPFCQKYVLHIHTAYQSGILGQGGGARVSQANMVRNAEKFLYKLYEKEDFRLVLKPQLYKCIYSWL